MDGFGVNLRRLMGDNGAKQFLACKDKKITAVSLESETLRIEVEGGLWVSFTDDGQSCCESRYMVCDDDLPSFVGSTLLDASLDSADLAEAEYGDHEIQFLRVKTSTGMISVANHNEHNGYYGGFYIACSGGVLEP